MSKVTIAPSARVRSGVIFEGNHEILIGPGCVIESGCRFVATSGPISVGANTLVEERVTFYNALSPSVETIADSDIEGSVNEVTGTTTTTTTAMCVGDWNCLEPGLTLFRGVSTDDRVRVGAKAVLLPHTRVGHDTEIGAGVRLMANSQIRENSVVVKLGYRTHHRKVENDRSRVRLRTRFEAELRKRLQLARRATSTQ